MIVQNRDKAFEIFLIDSQTRVRVGRRVLTNTHTPRKSFYEFILHMQVHVVRVSHVHEAIAKPEASSPFTFFNKP